MRHFKSVISFSLFLSLVVISLIPAILITIMGKTYPLITRQITTYTYLDFVLIGLFSIISVSLCFLFLFSKRPIPIIVIFLLISIAALTKLIQAAYSDFLLIGLLSLSVVLCFFSLYGKFPRITGILFFALAILAIIDIIFITKYNAVLDANAIAILGETNASELIDFLSGMPSFLWLIFLYLFIALVFCLYTPARFKRVPWRRLFVYALSVIAIITYEQYNFYKKDYIPHPEKQLNYFAKSWQFKDRIARAAFPASIPFTLSDYYYQRKELRYFADLNKNYDFHAQRQFNPPERQVYILVIGESSRADHWGINGYSRNTSPMLSQRSDIISFQKMYTFFPLTRYSVPIIISRKPIDYQQDYFNQASIVTYFKQIGFDTAWISLQAPFGQFDSPVSVYAYEANHIQFLNPVDYNTHGKYDYEAIPDILKTITSTDNNLFIVVHTLGNHFLYSDRYDERMRVFQPDRYENTYPVIYNKDDQVVLTNSYDNSVIAVDYFLGTLILEIEKLELSSFVFYVSDHGQGLFDDGNTQAGHGYVSTATLHIPAFFWASPQYSATHHQLINNMKANTTQITSTDMVFETLVSLSGGTISEPRPHLDLTKNEVMVTPTLMNRLSGLEKKDAAIQPAIAHEANH